MVHVDTCSCFTSFGFFWLVFIKCMVLIPILLLLTLQLATLLYLKLCFEPVPLVLIWRLCNFKSCSSYAASQEIKKSTFSELLDVSTFETRNECQLSEGKKTGGGELPQNGRVLKRWSQEKWWSQKRWQDCLKHQAIVCRIPEKMHWDPASRFHYRYFIVIVSILFIKPFCIILWY